MSQFSEAENFAICVALMMRYMDTKPDEAISWFSSKEFTDTMSEIRSSLVVGIQESLKKLGTYKSRKHGISASEYTRIMKEPDTMGFDTLLKMCVRVCTALREDA